VNKTTRIIIDIIVIIIGIVFLTSGIKDAYNLYQSSQIKDNLVFRKSYRDMEEDNIYKYISIKEANKLLEKESGTILIGSPHDSWTQILVKPLHDYSKEYVSNIYYLETDDLDTESKEYTKLIDKLGEISTPMIIITKNGKTEVKLTKNDIYDDENFEGAPIDYFNEENIASLQSKLSTIASLK